MRPPPPGYVIAIGAWLLAGAGLLLAKALLAGNDDRIVQFLASLAAIALPVLTLLPAVGRQPLGLGPAPPRWLLGGLLLGPLAFAVSVASHQGLIAIFGMPAQREVEVAIAEVRRAYGMPLLVLLAALLPGLVEEALFRGPILRGLRRHLPATASVLLSALLFALLHLDRWRFLPQFALGVICGVVALRSGSCWPAALIHAGHNACVLAGMALRPPA